MSTNYLFLRLSVIIIMYLLIVCVNLMYLFYNEKKTDPSEWTNQPCQNRREPRFDVLIQEFDVHVNVTLSHCFIPTGGSKQLTETLIFIRRHTAAFIYERGCSAPIFSKIDKTKNLLIINCPPSMQPKYGFTNRTAVIHNYTTPVSLKKQEWVYARCHLPFNPVPTIRLHFHALPLHKPLAKVNKKANIIFIQIDAMGRQSLYRRMPRTYELLSAAHVESIEFRYLNVHGPNSRLNMKQIYCGGNTCLNTSLLRLYKQAGYATSLLMSHGTRWKEFLPSNVIDRYLGNNYFAEFDNKSEILYETDSGCVAKSTWIIDETLNYLSHRIGTMRQGGWFSINNILDGHNADELNNYAVMDSRFQRFLRNLDASKVLNDSILILLGDHGLHRPKWAELWREFDRRNPFLFILVGKQVAGFASITNYLRANSDKLITHSDIYTTFAKFSRSSFAAKLTKAVNLFESNISISRTCRTAGIPDRWCNCWLPKSSSRCSN